MRSATAHRHSRLGLCLLLLVAVGLGSFTLTRAEVPFTGGLGVATGGWVTTYFLEPITYETGGAYYDQNNQLQSASYVFHHGIDVSGGCVAGTYPVYAAAAGTV